MLVRQLQSIHLLVLQNQSRAQELHRGNHHRSIRQLPLLSQCLQSLVQVLHLKLHQSLYQDLVALRKLLLSRRPKSLVQVLHLKRHQNLYQDLVALRKLLLSL